MTPIMEWLPAAVIGVAVLAVVAMPFVLARSGWMRRNRGRLRGAMGVVDEIYRPAMHEEAVVREAKEEAGAEAPAPGEDALPPEPPR